MSIVVPGAILIEGMNIEEILPELFNPSSSPSSPPSTEKRVYYCQRCLNHGLRFKRKNHKTDCAFRFCTCNDCEMICRRRELNSLLRQEYSPDSMILHGHSQQPSLCHSSSLLLSPSQSECSPSLVLPPTLLSTLNSLPPSNEDASSSSSSGSKERRPNCQRCAQHNVINRLKGHKRACPFKECGCAKCQVVLERQKLMADQIKLRRKQKKEKQLMSDPAPSPPTSAPNGDTGGTSICPKCTQQAVSYHQLMSMIDPTTTVDAISTLALLLPLCPHKDE